MYTLSLQNKHNIKFINITNALAKIEKIKCNIEIDN